MIKRYCLKSGIFTFLLFSSILVFGEPPNGNVKGKLIFLGKTHDLSQSVWASITTAGEFKLEAQGHQTVDEWAKERRGIHLSLSPFVSQGSGGTHRLINRENNKILDSQNQQGGIVFPPFPSEPPSVMPPIVIPPEPPGISNPIFSTQTPSTSVQTPVASTSKTGIVGAPTAKPFSRPRTQPFEQQRTEKKVGGVLLAMTNSRAVGPNIITSDVAKITMLSMAEQSKIYSSKQSLMSHKSLTSTTPEKKIEINNNNKQAPITRGRQLNQNTLWNIWSDNHYFHSNDDRHNISATGNVSDFSMGADRYITNKLAIGTLFSLVRFNNNALDGDLKNRGNGFNVGPYFGYILLKNWSLDGSLTYGQLQNNNELISLKSNYDTKVYHAHLHSTVVDRFGNFQLRLEPLISFTHFRNPAYRLNGIFNHRPFQIDREAESFNFNFAEFRLEGNYLKETSKGNLIQPYAKAGIDYVFTQPNEGQVLTGNLTLATISPVTGTLIVGVRALFAKAFLINGSAGYLSIGQNGLNVWGFKLMFSYFF